MFSGNVFAAKEHQLAEKWTSPRPPRERLLFFGKPAVDRQPCPEEV